MTRHQESTQMKRRIVVTALAAAVVLLVVSSHHVRTQITPIRAKASSPTAEAAEASQDDLQATNGLHAERWIVLTSISYPTEVVRKLAALDGWKVVMVADKKTPVDWTHHNVVFLSVEEQQRLPYHITKHLPWNNYGRKNIGYMYAIHHGAKVIYETDDDNELIVPTILQLVPGSVKQPELIPDVRSDPVPGEYTMLDLPSNSSGYFNPYPLFGVPQMWPRGVPLQNIKDAQAEPHCFRRALAKPLIQQGLANNDPDVDAIYRLTLPLGVKFDANAFSVVLPRNVVTPFNSQNTLFLRDALWALVLPVTTTMRVCDIWRGYWAQRLLWDIGGQLAFIPPTVNQQRNPHTMFNDFQQELPLYNQAGHLVDDLRSWVPRTNSLPDRMVELARLMADKGYWGNEDVRLIQAWVADLQTAGYKFPSLNPAVTTTAAVPVHSEVATSEWGPNTFTFAKRWCKHQDKILVVNINDVASFHAEITGFLYAAYKPWFRDVYFTGEVTNGVNITIPNFIKCYATNRYTLTKRGGHFAQVCLAEVASQLKSRGIAADGGYLYINDDVTFSPCMLSRYNSSKIWYNEGFVLDYSEATRYYAMPRDHSQHINITHVDQNNEWHFRFDFSNNRMPGALPQHTQSALANAYGWMAENVKMRLQDPLHTGQHIFGIGQADFFYIPARLVHEYEVWARHMREYFVFSEVALPNILGLLGKGPDDYEIIPATSLWGISRKHLSDRVQDVMPLHGNLNLAASCEIYIANLAKREWLKTVPPCGPKYQQTRLLLAPKSGDRLGDMGNLFMHPTKLTDMNLRQHWTSWWQSQTCQA